MNALINEEKILLSPYFAKKRWRTCGFESHHGHNTPPSVAEVVDALTTGFDPVPFKIHWPKATGMPVKVRSLGGVAWQEDAGKRLKRKPGSSEGVSSSRFLISGCWLTKNPKCYPRIGRLVGNNTD